MDSLTDIFNRYDSDKNSKFHNYCRQYENLVRDYRTKDVSFLELGVFTGNSLKIWRDVFPHAKCIVGVDINPDCKKYENIENCIFVEIGDATNSNFIEYLTKKYGNFDIILDDASHKNTDVIMSFEYLFPLMKDNGLYIVEDTITYKVPDYINKSYPNQLEYFSGFIPYLNQWGYDGAEPPYGNFVDPYKIKKKAANIFEATIDMIVFGVSFIGIYKKVRHHWL
jgi:hypothetical protein